MRADLYIYVAGYAKSRQQAKSLIGQGVVTIDGQRVEKPSEPVDETMPHEVILLRGEKYVSRGGMKLEAALDSFGIEVSGLSAVDIGASTGGFTDCLLRRGAARVVAADSGRGQLDPRLAGDARVVSVEKFNARRLAEDGGGAAELIASAGGKAFDIAVVDVSFISQTYIIPGLGKILRQDGCFVGLVKPQFEAGREAVGGGGIVRETKYHVSAIKKVVECAAASGFGCLGVIRSPISGGDGNIEYLAAFRLGVGGIVISDAELKKLTGSIR